MNTSPVQHISHSSAYIENPLKDLYRCRIEKSAIICCSDCYRFSYLDCCCFCFSADCSAGCSADCFCCFVNCFCCYCSYYCFDYSLLSPRNNIIAELIYKNTV